MQRRGFIKLTLATTLSLLMPQYIYAREIDLSNISFSSSIFDEGRQTIIVFLGGGPSPLSGNLSNLDDIELSSQNSYTKYFGSRYLNKIDGYDLWKEAGGESMQRMLDSQDMTIIRTCYSAQRDEVNNKAHGLCTEENMKGNFDTSKPGYLTTLSRVMSQNSKFTPSSLPFVSLSGENDFYSGGNGNRLKPISIDYKLSNPFARNMSSSSYYSNDERAVVDYKLELPKIDTIFDDMAKSKNSVAAMNDFLENRKLIFTKIDSIAEDRYVSDTNKEDKYLTTYGYVKSDFFHRSLATAIEFLDSNTGTRTITLGTSGLGGWDDHSYAQETYTRRMANLFAAIEAGVRHLDGINKKNKISIIIYGEFGRNVNLNTSYGWDHGNTQNLYLIGGSEYFNHAGGLNAIVGETVVDNGGTPKSGRVWLKPKEGSYWCEPLSVAATIYAIHGIQNPEELTGGYSAINPSINGQDFLSL